MARTWSYITGRKDHSRIRVYERVPGGPLQVEFMDNDGRQRMSLASIVGHPVYDRDLAVQIAERMAAAQARVMGEITAEALLGLPRRRTLDQLLSHLHRNREPVWSDSHAAHQRKFKAFWLDALGADADLRKITAAQVERVARDAARRNEWSRRTEGAYLRYLIDAFYFGERKLKWFGPEHNLSAVTIPRPDSVGLAYTDAEVIRLLEEAPKVDLRCGAAAEIAYATGRRLGAIRRLKATDYRVEAVDGLEVGVVRFRGEHDKARRSSEAVLTEQARVLVELLLQRPAVRSSGWLFPAGDLGDAHKRKGAMQAGELIRMLHDAEKLAKIPRVRGRAFHGIKRRSITAAARATGDMGIAAKQSGTNASTLQRIYEQDDIEAKVRLARLLSERRRQG